MHTCCCRHPEPFLGHSPYGKQGLNPAYGMAVAASRMPVDVDLMKQVLSEARLIQ